MPAQYVKPFVKTNKNDYIDAEAIREAVDKSRDRSTTEPRLEVFVTMASL
jgi:transposase